MNLITLAHATFTYPHKPIFTDLSLTIKPGQRTAILGPNGVGKSTLLKCLLGQLPFASNQISYHPSLIHQQHPLLGYVPQVWPSYQGYAVLEVVTFGRAARISSWSVPQSSDYQHARRVIEQLDLTRLIDRPFHHLSGGEQQLVILAQALTTDSKVIILDEPTSDLDFYHQHQLLQLIDQLADQKLAIIFTTHQPLQAAKHADQLLMLFNDQTHRLGKPSNLFTDANLTQLYGTDIEIITLGPRHGKLLKTIQVKQ